MVHRVKCKVFELVEEPVTDGVIRVRALVDLDVASAKSARDQLSTICTNGPAGGCLMVEVGADRFVAVRGLRVLVEASELMRGRGGTLVLVSESRGLARVLQIMELDGKLLFSRTVEDAQREARRRDY